MLFLFIVVVGFIYLSHPDVILVKVLDKMQCLQVSQVQQMSEKSLRVVMMMFIIIRKTVQRVALV